MAGPRSSGSSASLAGATGTSSAIKCATECGRMTWTGASTRGGSQAHGSGDVGARRPTSWLRAPA
eukprot:4024370-Alexandrium_andersonii.AAC.1